MKSKKFLISILAAAMLLCTYNTCFAKPWTDSQGNIIEVPDDYEEPVNNEFVDMSQDKNTIIIRANKNYEINVWIYPESRFAIFGKDYIVYQDSQALPFVDENNRTQMPLRFMADTFQSNIEWDSETNSAAVTSLDGKVFTFTDGSNILTIDGEETEMDTTARLINGKLYVPIRYLNGTMADMSFHMFEYSEIQTVIDFQR